jgi:hypothetical protein
MTKALVERLLTEHAPGNFLNMGDMVKTLNAERAEAASMIRLLSEELLLASDSLKESSRQIEYLHEKFGTETGSGNAVIDINRRVVNVLNRHVGE